MKTPKNIAFDLVEELSHLFVHNVAGQIHVAEFCVSEIVKGKEGADDLSPFCDKLNSSNQSLQTIFSSYRSAIGLTSGFENAVGEAEDMGKLHQQALKILKVYFWRNFNSLDSSLTTQPSVQINSNGRYALFMALIAVHYVAFIDSFLQEIDQFSIRCHLTNEEIHFYFCSKITQNSFMRSINKCHEECYKKPFIGKIVDYFKTLFNQNTHNYFSTIENLFSISLSLDILTTNDLLERFEG